jgi:hypothetical protein
VLSVSILSSRSTMVRVNKRRSALSNIELMVQILQSSRIKREEYLQFSELLLSGQSLTNEERDYLNRIFDNFRLGRLRLLD